MTSRTCWHYWNVSSWCLQIEQFQDSDSSSQWKIKTNVRKPEFCMGWKFCFPTSSVFISESFFREDRASLLYSFTSGRCCLFPCQYVSYRCSLSGHLARFVFLIHLKHWLLVFLAQGQWQTTGDVLLCFSFSTWTLSRGCQQAQRINLMRPIFCAICALGTFTNSICWYLYLSLGMFSLLIQKLWGMKWA